MAGWGGTAIDRGGRTTTPGSTNRARVNDPMAHSAPAGPPVSSIAQLLGGSGGNGTIPGTLGVRPGGPGMPTFTGNQSAPVGAPVPTPLPMPTGSPVVNKAEANPTATSAIDTLMARAKGDMGLGKEIDRGAQDIRSRALAGIAGDRMSRVARGVNGTGIDTFDANRQSDQQKAEVNRMVNDRTIAAESMRNDLLGSTANLALNTSGQQLQAQGMNTSAANAQSDLELRRQAQANQQQNEAWHMAESAGARARDEQLRSFQTLLNFLS